MILNRFFSTSKAAWALKNFCMPETGFMRSNFSPIALGEILKPNWATLPQTEAIMTPIKSGVMAMATGQNEPSSSSRAA